MVRSYRKLKVGDYIKIQAIPKDLSKRERAAEIMAIVTGKPVEYFESLTHKSFDKMASRLLFLDSDLPSKRVKKVIWLGMERYRLVDKLEESSTEMWASIMHYRTKGTAQNMAHILAWMYRPTFGKFDPEKAEKLFRERANISEVYGAFFLFSRIMRRWKIGLDLLQETSQAAMMTLMNHLTKDLGLLPYQENTDGVTQ